MLHTSTWVKVFQTILWVSEYCRISTLFMLLLSDFKLPASLTSMLSKEHFTCCWKQGLINQLIKVVSRERGQTPIVWTVLGDGLNSDQVILPHVPGKEIDADSLRNQNIVWVQWNLWFKDTVLRDQPLMKEHFCWNLGLPLHFYTFIPLMKDHLSYKTFTHSYSCWFMNSFEVPARQFHCTSTMCTIFMIWNITQKKLSWGFQVFSQLFF